MQCIVTLITQNQNKQNVVIGVVLVPLPKNTNSLTKIFKITQCADKAAQLDLSLTIRALDQPYTPPFNPSMSSIAIEDEGSMFSEGQIQLNESSDRQLVCGAPGSLTRVKDL